MELAIVLWAISQAKVQGVNWNTVRLCSNEFLMNSFDNRKMCGVGKHEKKT